MSSLQKYKNLRDQYDIQKKKADYLNSARGMAAETIKGIPAAAKTVAGKIAGFPKYATGKVLNKINKIAEIEQGFYAPKTKEERKIREQNLQRLRDAIKKWKEEHPGKPIPKEFHDLE